MLDRSLPKSERLHSKKAIGTLFSKGQRFSQFPLKFTYLLAPHSGETSEKDLKPVQILFSVSKRNFKLAVHRNKLKRRLKEAYRLNKTEIIASIPEGFSLLVAVNYMTNKKLPFSELESKLKLGLSRLEEKIHP